jgi:hypothetical protein
MVNKFHKSFQVGKQIYSKLAKSKKKTDAEEHFDTVYKLDKTGKKDKIISSMNEVMKRKKHSASPSMVDRYHEVMTSDSKYTKEYWKKKEGKK